MLLSKNKCGVLDGISGNNGSVVSLGVGLLDLTFKKNSDSELNDLLLSRILRITLDLEDADIVLAVLGRLEENRHGGYF